MNKIYDIFEMVLPKKKQSNNKIYIKKHKIRNINPKINEDNYIDTYNELICKLYTLKITDPTDLETISKLEIQVKDYEQKNNIKNTEKIDAILIALEKYYAEITKEEEPSTIDKRRGLYIYEDLSYKLNKLVNNNPRNSEKIKKIELKLIECKNKYQLSDIEQIDAKIKALEKYEETIFKQEQSKNIGLNTYKTLITELNNLKETKLKNNQRITQIESKIKKCSNQYNLSNLDKINIQFKILEKYN